MFLRGTLLFLLKEKLPLSVPAALFGLAAAIALGLMPFGAFVAPFCVAYMILAIGLNAPVIPLGKFRGWNLSYETYIFAFPIGRAVRGVTGTENAWFLAIVSTLIVLPIAALRWRFVKKPAPALAPRKSPTRAVLSHPR